jgi:hypothetical protein
MSKREKTWSLKEIDEARGTAKGTAFLAFKQLRDGFDEGRDFYYLNGGQDDIEIETLRVQGRVYANSVNAVLLTETGYTAVMEYLDD